MTGWKAQGDSAPWNGEPWKSPSGLFFNNQLNWLPNYLSRFSGNGLVYLAHPAFLSVDRAGTQPVQHSGERVGVWRSALSSGRQFVALSDADRPVYRTDGVHHWIEFNGSARMQDSDFIRSSETLGQGWSLMASLRQSGSSSFRGIMGSMKGTNLRVYLNTATGGAFQFGAGSAFNSKFGPNIRDGELRVIGGFDTGSGYFRRIAGEQSGILSRNLGTGTATGFGMGYADGVGSSNLLGSIYGMVYTPGLLEPEEILRVEEYLLMLGV